jgi:oligopeptide/dipeptide ABC transporter ATP-binding protein
MMTPLLCAQDLKLSIYHQGKWITPLKGVNLTINHGQIVGLVGESGSGKSLTARALLKLFPGRQYQMSAKSLTFNQVDLLSAKEPIMQTIRGKGIGLILQNAQSCLNPTMKIGAQIEESLLIHQIVSNKKEAISEGKRLLDLVKIINVDKVYQQYPFELSGGMRQRVVCATAVASRPKILIADEPTSALDLETTSFFLKLLKQIQYEFGSSILLITHDLNLAKAFCDQIVVMYGGQTIETFEKAHFNSPFHPYTQLLMQCTPTLTSSKSLPLDTIPGSFQFSSQSNGCVFADRCHKAMNICVKKPPTIETVSTNHHVNCFLRDREILEERIGEHATATH